jgi:hypothetical protein
MCRRHGQSHPSITDAKILTQFQQFQSDTFLELAAREIRIRSFAIIQDWGSAA